MARILIGFDDIEVGIYFDENRNTKNEVLQKIIDRLQKYIEK